MQTDWVSSERIYCGESGKIKFIIWDFNGHYLTYSSTVTLALYADNVEFTDSSAAGNGYIKSYNASCGVFNVFATRLIVSGGTIWGAINFIAQELVMTGGQITNYDNAYMSTLMLITADEPTYYLAPYIKKTPIEP